MTGPDFKIWRKLNAYTQKEIADELGVSRQTVIAWEKLSKPLPRLLELALQTVENSQTITGKRLHVSEYREMRKRPDIPGSKAPRQNTAPLKPGKQ